MRDVSGADTAAPRRWHRLPGDMPVLGGLVLAAVAFDQAGKALALLQPSVPLLDLRLGFNTGASFGLLSSPMDGRPLLMAAATGLLTAGIAAMVLRARLPQERARLALVVGGSLGHIIDRRRRGAVTDFIDIYWRDWYRPTFNTADVAIFCSVALTRMGTLRPAERKGGSDG